MCSTFCLVFFFWTYISLTDLLIISWIPSTCYFIQHKIFGIYLHEAWLFIYGKSINKHVWNNNSDTIDLMPVKHVSNLSNCPRVEDAHQSEARGLLWRGVQLAGEEETGAGCPPALQGHADLPGWGWETAQTSRHQTVVTPTGGLCEQHRNASAHWGKYHY